MGGSTGVRQNPRMRQNDLPLRASSPAALNEGLAEWFGWFSSAPLPENLASLIDQLEAACPPLEPAEA